ncbi:MAG: alpha amylase N-terminal ig-like domain-containing protein, partial [Acidimicrobiia bacterium]|nr:alpha amylase N-terminal ig-like domain-containing protein [Acidimicrobiia bacterium]
MDHVYQYYRKPGHLFPYDVRYDPSNVAHCERQEDESIRFRLTTEPGFTEAIVARIDGVGTPMRRYAEDQRFAYWEAVVDPGGPTFEYSFALRFGTDRHVYLVPAGVTNSAERLDFWSLDVSLTPRVEVPAWARGAIIYQIFPDRFADGDPSLTPVDAAPWGSPPHPRRFQGGDLDGIAEKAPYLADLGVDAVYLNPVFQSKSVHRYDAIDYYEVDTALGGNEALANMVDALHARDIRVILDASFNHCHPHFFAFRDVITKGPDSPFWGWFEVHDYPLSVKFRPRVARELFGDRSERFMDYQINTAEQAGLTLIETDDDGPPVEP